MPTLIEMREKRANVWNQALEFNARHAKGDTMSAEDEAAWARALDEVDELKAKIDTRERTERLDKEFAEIDDRTTRGGTGDPSDGTGGASGGDGASLDDYRKAFTSYMRFGLNELEPEERQLVRKHFSADKGVARALGAGTGTAGGYTVPEGFWAKVTETMRYFGGVLQAGVETLDTDSGQDIPWPTNDDTGNKGALLSENTVVTEQDVTFGGKTLGAYMYSSKLVRVSLQLLQDSGVDIESFVARKLGERLGRIFNEHWTTGTGVNQPQGWVTGATTGATSAGATAITVNDIINLIHSVDVAYRSGPDVGFQLHDLTLAYVRKIRDDSGGAGLGRPIWEPSIQIGQPDSLFGYATTVNNDMASPPAGVPATTQKLLGFGGWRSMYVARRVNGAQMLRLAERYADFLQVGFLGFERADGIVQDASAAKVLVQL
jgi:HK97 family phage major capsid protein